MKITICAVGRLRRGPELELVTDYLDRFGKTGRGLGLGPAQIIEVEDKKNIGMQAEAELLLRAIPKSATVCILDERGDIMTSPQFSQNIAKWRDAGQSDLAFIIGGADGLDPSIKDRANFALSFGKMVWPHMMVRVMLAEQLYRAASIMSGTPYHRE